MPTITINTNTQPSGISYAWDRDWDIKTVADARRAYLRLRDKLASIPETLKRMEALAAKDGFALPVEDFGAVFDQLARTALLANPDRLLVLSVDPDSYGVLSYGTPVVMSGAYYNSMDDEDEVKDPNPEPPVEPALLVDSDGRAWSENNNQTLAEAAELLSAGKYEAITHQELIARIDAKLAEYQRERDAEQ